MRDLPEVVRRFAEQNALLPPESRGVVAVSGGVDSLVLLDVLRTLDEWPLHVATLDHGLRGADGAADAEYVRALAERWGLPCTVGRADVPALAAACRWGLEDAARRARYTFLAQVAMAAGAQWIAVAHNANDQAETVLMHVIRGSGLDGLRGMRPASMLPGDVWLPDLAVPCDPPLPAGMSEAAAGAAGRTPVITIVRPLLEVSRERIEAYAADRGLTPRQDATNTDPAYLRNRIRREVMPMLEEINPNMRGALVRLASIAGDDADWLTAAGEAALARLLLPDNTRSIPPALRLDRVGWMALGRAEQRAAFRAAARRLRLGLRDLGLDHVDNALEAVAKAENDLFALVDLPGGLNLWRCNRDAFVLFYGHGDPAGWIDAPSLAQGQSFGPFAPGDPVTFVCGAWTLSSRPLLPGDNVAALHADPLAAALSVPEGATILLRTREPGDRWQPRGLRGHSQGLKAVWQSMKVPVVWRDWVPLLVVDGQIAWLVASEGGQAIRGRVAEPFALPEGFAEVGAGAGRAVIVVRWARIEQE